MVTLLNDATLNELIAAAQEKNADLRSAVARLDQADAAARRSRGQPVPQHRWPGWSKQGQSEQKTATWTPNAPDPCAPTAPGSALSYESTSGAGSAA